MFDSLISASQLMNEMNSPDLIVFDCRFDLGDVGKGERLYRESHIPGAMYAHLDHHLSSPITAESGRHPLPDQDAFCRWLGDCGFDGSQQVVAYDDSFCGMASRLWWLLRCMGHKQVACLDGGWQAWIAAQGAVDAEPARPVAVGAPKLTLAASSIVTTQQVLANLDSHEFLLVDVRTGERFRGEAEPIDPIAGHIPGACSFPLSDNLAVGGCYESPDELTERYSDLIAKKTTAEQVYMCGSGVTACHSVLALASAGFAMPRVYAGSWSEWIRDPARPIATGDA